MDSQTFWNSNSLSSALSINIPGKIGFSKASIDSRTILPGEFFIALQGESFDGNDYAVSALEKGASGVLVSKINTGLEQFRDKVILVENVLIALNRLAEYRRANFKGKVIGVTGSVGKTSTKEMLKVALGSQYKTFASFGNFNNHFGLPLNLVNMPADTEIAILELGMSSAGELRALSMMAKPHVSLITNVEPVHLAFFNDVEDIAHAKAEIFAGMERSGIAVLNQDNRYYDILKKHAEEKGLEVLTFAECEGAKFRLCNFEIVNNMTKVKASYFNREISYNIGGIGRHLAVNSLGVLAAAFAVGANVGVTALSIADYSVPAGRGAKFFIDRIGVEVIDDCYNASPTAVKSSLGNLRHHKRPGSRLLVVLGDMRDLGPLEDSFHKSLVSDVIGSGAEKVFTIGQLMEGLFKVLPEEYKGVATANSEQMSVELPKYLKSGDIVLFKGSKSMKLYKVINALKEAK